MTNNATSSETNKPNGASATESDLITTARSIGASAGSAAATAADLAQTAQEYRQKLAGAAVQAKDFVSEKVVVASEKIKELQDVDLGELAENAKAYARRKPAQALPDLNRHWLCH